jgi:hypothetical protein
MKSRNRLIFSVCLALLSGTCLSAPSLAQKGDVAALSAKINELGRAGKYAEAVAPAQGQAYGNQGRDGEAEPLFKRSIAILEKTTGLDSPDLR